MKKNYTQNPINTLLLTGKSLNRWLIYGLSLLLTFVCVMSLKGQDFAYVPNNGSNSVSVINTTTNAVTTTITGVTGAYGVAVSSNGSRAYITGGTSSNVVYVINTTTNTVIASINVGLIPISLAISPDGSRLYVANLAASTVSVINTATNTVMTVVTVGSVPYGAAVSPDGSKVYIPNLGGNTISVINTATNTVSATINVGTSPIGVTVTPDGSKVYVMNNGSSNVSVINTTTNTVLATTTVGNSPTGGTVSPDGSRVYVTNQGSNNISVINTTTNAVVSTITVGTSPAGISVTPDGTKVYVVNSNTNNVSVINTATNTVSATTIVGTTPVALGSMMRIVYTSPEINLQGNSVSIADGDITPSTADNTDFGVIGTGGTIIRTFTIQNTGTDILNITSVVSNNTKFVVSDAPTTVAAGSSATFVVTYTPTGITTDNATITVNNNDNDEAVYDFAITGKQINALPTGVRGNTGNFSGVINQCMQTSNSFSIGSNDFTINLWVNPRNTQVGYANILNFQHTVGSSMVIQQNASATNQYYLAFASSAGTFNLSTNVTLTSNQWQHLCYVKSGTNLIAYLNGMQIGTVTVPNSVYYTPQKLELGGDTQASRPYNGLIDEVQIWNTARTQAQIRESMHLTLSGTEAGLVSYYQFNETTGNVIDVVAGNNGALQNGATRISSDVTVAQGTAQRITPSVGLNTFTNANVSVNFTTAPADEFVAYQLRGNPINGVNALNTGTNTASCYWIIRQFGVGGVAYNDMNFILPSNNTISTADVTTPSNLKLYKRPDNVTTAFPASFASATSANNTTKVVQFTGFASQTSFSQFEIGSTSSPLPITLLSFEGKRTNENNVLLEWKTATEQNNKGFEIESSKNAVEFNKIAFVDGAGNSTNIKNYQFNIQNSDDMYYRLKQIDFDGSFSYSNIIFVKGIENIVNVYPNPTTENINIKTSKEGFVYEIFTLQGNSLIKNTATSNTANINIKSFQKGVYFVHIIQNNNRVVKKIIVE